MKYFAGALLVVGAVAMAWLALPQSIIDECCEYIGLVAPEGVSEVPGVDHAQIEEARVDGALPDSIPGMKIGDVPEPFTLLDLDGNEVRVDAGSGRTVVVWVSSLCPTSKVYEVRLNELARDYPDVRWVMINSAAMESVSELRDHFLRADENRLKLPVLKDDLNVIADRFGARVSTETFVFDNGLRYRGAIDDARNPTRVGVSYLRQVLDALEAGKGPPYQWQPPKGCCPIDRVKIAAGDKQ